MKKDNTPAQDGDKREWEKPLIANLKIAMTFTQIGMDNGMEEVIDAVIRYVVPKVKEIESRTAERTLAEAREVVEEKVSEMITTINDLYRESVVDDANKANEESYSMAVVRQVGDDIARALEAKKK